MNCFYLSSLPPLVSEKNLKDDYSTAFYRSDVLPVTQTTVSKHGRRKQSTDSSRWPGLILYSFTDRLLTKGALLPLCCLEQQYQYYCDKIGLLQQHYFHIFIYARAEYKSSRLKMHESLEKSLVTAELSILECKL